MPSIFTVHDVDDDGGKHDSLSIVIRVSRTRCLQRHSRMPPLWCSQSSEFLWVSSPRELVYDVSPALSARPVAALLGSVSCTEAVEANLQFFDLSDVSVNRERLELFASREFVIRRALRANRVPHGH